MQSLFNRNSIMKKLTLFLAVVLAVQCGLFAGFLLLGGTLERLNQNALDIFNERTINRKSYLEDEMLQRWSNLGLVQSNVEHTVARYLAENDLNTADLNVRHGQLVPLMSQLCDPLISLLRNNAVTGAFLVFNGDLDVDQPILDSAFLQTGLYLRDMDPGSNPPNNSDIMVERGSAELIRSLNLPMDVNWKPSFVIRSEDNFYFKPFQAARANTGRSADELGYWCDSFTLADDNVPIITYSQPLLGADGQPYGIIGVEIATDYLRRFLPSDELSLENSGAYLLTSRTETGPNTEAEYHCSALHGATAKRLLDSRSVLHILSTPVYSNIYEVSDAHAGSEKKEYASVQPLTLYNGDSPFVGEEWALIGLMAQKVLFQFSASVAYGVIGLALLTMVLGVLVSFLVCSHYTRPIRTLAESVRHLDPEKPVSLPPVNISEIDDLSASIERLSRNVSNASSRMTQIISMSDLRLAAFELNPSAASPYYTPGFFALIDRPEPVAPLTTKEFSDILSQWLQYVEEGSLEENNVLVRFPHANSGYRWVRLQTTRSNESVLGVLTDVTDEMIEKRRLEHERDYDLLTNLLNRRSFQRRLHKLNQQPAALGIAAMLMMDLDNLKYLNDSYGHDCGDEYIRCAADVLRGFTAYGGLAFRISGDEFYLFLSGYESREALNKTIELLHKAIDAAFIPLPNGQPYRLRASMGVAWYPDDSRFLSELVRYADFAMYEAKTAAKGGSRNFNLSSYQRDSFLLYSREELNRILEESAVDYAFQPIVSCADGSLLGYEALMRPRSATLASPQDVLRIARAQSKLQQVERLTWFRAMEVFDSFTSPDNAPYLFINSVSSHILSPSELADFLSRYERRLDRIVIELTEGDEQSTEATDLKQRVCREHNIRLALDDFGTGYSNDAVLLTIRPDFVKVDVTIVSGIDRDKTRQTMFRNLIGLCRSMGIKVIAEGVETPEELRMIAMLGADYIQGYYTGTPSFHLSPVADSIVAEFKALHCAKGAEAEMP